MNFFQSARTLERARRRDMVKENHPLPRTQRCELLNFPRSTSYYQPKPVSDADQAMMKWIDRIHTARPYLGSRRIVDALGDEEYQVNRKRVHRLMLLMGIQAIHPGSKTSQPHPQHKIYPYLLRYLNVDRATRFGRAISPIYRWKRVLFI